MEQQLQKKEQFINELKQALEIDCQKEEARIIEFIQKTIKELHKDGAVIGLSGGLDSSMCAYLLTKAIGKDKVLAVLLPERDSSAVNHEHAHLVAETLGLKTIDHDMTKTLQEMGVYDIGIKMLESEEEVARYTEKDKAKAKLFLGGYAYPDMISALYGGETSTKWKLVEKLAKKTIYDHFAFQDTKVKLRMVYLYFYAKQHNYAVIGTSDKSEYSIGLYVKYGDGANDIQILRHLYKTQLKQLARYMGLPPEIINKPHSGDLYANAPHTDKLGMSYEELDMLFLAMDKGYSDEKLVEIVPKKGVDGIKQLKKVAALIKSLPLSVDSL